MSRDPAHSLAALEEVSALLATAMALSAEAVDADLKLCRALAAAVTLCAAASTKLIESAIEHLQAEPALQAVPPCSVL